MDIHLLNRLTGLVILVLCTYKTVLCDYPCRCSYQPEIAVYEQMSAISNQIGTLYEFDCKPVIGTVVNGWVTIQFQHQVGFVMENFTENQDCQGSPPIGDILTTAAPTVASTTDHAAATVVVTDRPTILISFVTQTGAPVTTTSTAATLPHATTSQGHVNTGSLIPTCTAINGNQEFSYNGHRYQIITHKSTWNDARKGCLQLGGGLVEISDDVEQAAVYGAVSSCYGSSVWIGLHDQDHEETFQWASGAPLIYSFWHAGRKDPIFHGFEDCVEMEVGQKYTGDWQDVVCGRHNSYVCEFDNGVTGPTPGHVGAPNMNINTDGDISLCPLQIQQLTLQDHRHELLGQYGSSCYELYNGRVTWEQGEHHCVSHGGHLVTINSASEQAWIEAFMSRHDRSNFVWLGLNDQHQEETFVWTSGEAMNYTNWVAGYHLDHLNHDDEDCVLLMPFRNGQWDDVNCGHVGFLLIGDVGESHHAMCEYPIRGGLALLG